MKCSQHFDQQIQKVWNLNLASSFCRTGNTGKTKFVKFTKFCVHIVFTRNFQIETYKYYFILWIPILFRFQRYQTHYHSFLFLPLFWPESVTRIFKRFFIFLKTRNYIYGIFNNIGTFCDFCPNRPPLPCIMKMSTNCVGARVGKTWPPSSRF